MNHRGARRRPDRGHEPVEPVSLTRDQAASVARGLDLAANTIAHLPDLGLGVVGLNGLASQAGEWRDLAHAFAELVVPTVTEAVNA